MVSDYDRRTSFVEVGVDLSHTLFRTARRVPRAIAVIERDRVELTYEQLAARVLRLAGALGQLGVSRGGRVALVAQNCSAYIELLYACWTLGAAAVPINARLHPKEVAFILDNSASLVCFITDGADTSAIEAARTDGPTLFIDVDGSDYAALLHSAPLPISTASAATDPAWLFYTSGTTGRPKGVVLTHGNLMAMTLNYLADVDHASVGDHLLHAAPMSHGSGLYTVPNVAVGATQLIPASRAFDADEIRDVIAWTPNVKLFAAPTMVMRLVDAYGDDSEAVNLKSIIYGGGPMYVADSLRALDCFGPKLVQIYGQGEAPMTITVLPVGDHYDDHDGRRLERLGSVGRAQTGVELAVLDTLDRPVAAGEIGEVCVRGDVVMAGYLDNPEATATALANGWLHTGDLGRLDERGYLTLVDRSKDLIISGGSNIYPREVEEVLLLHPAIKEAAVIGVPDAQWGESVLAVVVKKEGHIPDEKELDLFCSSTSRASSVRRGTCLSTNCRRMRPARC
jgi:acyl-CoA synthetase (AMP-forming)/AMP-acid ligase II